MNCECLQTITDRNLRQGSFAVSLDGKVIAIRPESRDKKGKINLWQLETSIFSVQKSLEENFLAKLESLGQATQLSLRHNSKSVAISHNNQWVASGGSDPPIKLWQIGNYHSFYTFERYSRPVVSVAFSYDCSTLAAGSFRVIKLWNLAKQQLIQELECHEKHWIDSVAFSSDSELLATAEGNKIYFWQWEYKKLITVFHYPKQDHHLKQEHRIYSLAFRFIKNQHQIACGLENGEILLLDLKENKARLNIRFEGHSEKVHFLAFSSDKKTLVSGSLDGTIKKWKVPDIPLIPREAKPSDLLNYEPKSPKSGGEEWVY